MKKIFKISFICFLLLTSNAIAKSNRELAKTSQNPIAHLISLPFQNNTDLNTGLYDRTKNTLNIQPVWPFELNEDWNLITRTIFPVISQPVGRNDREFGLGDTVFTGFFVPRRTKPLQGFGPVILFPTSDDKDISVGEWGGGVSYIILDITERWVYGSLFNNVWSAENSRDQKVNLFTWQYFVNYNFGNGTYLLSAPIVTANWENSNNNRWTVPLGGGVGKVFRIGKMPINTNLQAYKNVFSTNASGDWQIRFQIQLLFPK